MNYAANLISKATTAVLESIITDKTLSDQEKVNQCEGLIRELRPDLYTTTYKRGINAS